MRDLLGYIGKHRYLLLIIVPAFLLYMLVIFPSGTYFCFDNKCGYYFWGAHGRDAIWHLAIAETSFNSIPFVFPTFSGESLYGYNWFLDFVIFLLAKSGIPSIVLYFKLIPVVWFVAFTGLLLLLARKIKDNSLFVGLFLFYSYFAGSFSYLLKLYHTGTIQDSSVLLPQPILHTMSNLQYAVSLIFFLMLLIYLKDKKISLKSSIVSGILVFLMLAIKFYAGLIGLFFAGIYIFINTHQSLERKKIIATIGCVLILLVFVVLAIIIFYNPFQSAKTGFPFAFVPLALVHTITESPDQFYLQGMTDARYYLQQFGIGPRLITIESLNLLVFLFFYLGTRFFALFYIGILFLKRKLSTFDAAIVMTIFFSIAVTVTLVQKGVWWNTIQFFFYTIFLLTIYLTRLTHDLFRNKSKLLVIISLFLIVLSIPTSYDLLWHFIKSSKPSYLSKEEIEALDFLKKQPEGVIFDQFLKEDMSRYPGPFPMYGYEDSSHIAAFTGKQQYLADIQTLGVSSVPYEKRLERVRKMDCSILKEVEYVYEIKLLPKSRRIISKCKEKGVKKIFENKLVTIFSVKKAF